jgi:hypothetical protein
MKTDEWTKFAKDLSKRLETEATLTLTVDEIMAAANSKDRSVRGRSFWLAAKRGEPFINAFARAGIKLDFEPNAVGQPVKSVTFRGSANGKAPSK